MSKKSQRKHLLKGGTISKSWGITMKKGRRHPTLTDAKVSSDIRGRRKKEGKIIAPNSGIANSRVHQQKHRLECETVENNNLPQGAVVRVVYNNIKKYSRK